MAILMLCNTPVYDIAADTVLNRRLCPFLYGTIGRTSKMAYKLWRDNRSYLKSNRIAEQLVHNAGGFATREAKRRLSLSDGYWVKYGYDKDTVFEAITPYVNEFSEIQVYDGAGRSSSVPELTLGGSQPKKWERGSDGLIYMVKVESPEQVNAEMLAVKLARKCGIPVMNAFIEIESGRIYADDYTSLRMGHGVINLVNMTDMTYSLIQFDQLGIVIRGISPLDVALGGYKDAGVEINTLICSLLQVVFDGIVGNPDRETNNSNWAIFMNNTTGVRTPSWMYDFNWANLREENVWGIKNIASYIKSPDLVIKRAGLVDKAVKQAEYIGSKCSELGLSMWESNAKRLIAELNK